MSPRKQALKWGICLGDCTIACHALVAGCCIRTTILIVAVLCQWLGTRSCLPVYVLVNIIGLPFVPGPPKVLKAMRLVLTILYVASFVLLLAQCMSQDPKAKEEQERYPVLELKWEETKVPLTIAIWVFIACLAKMGKLDNVIPACSSGAYTHRFSFQLVHEGGRNVP